LYFFHARWYNPSLGFFVGRDRYFEIDDIQILLSEYSTQLPFLHPYAFALNNPLCYFDPDGRLVMALPIFPIAPIMLPPLTPILVGGGAIIGGAWLAWEIWDYYKEHTKGERKSTKPKHDKGCRRKKMDDRGEKGDARRPFRSRRRPRPASTLYMGDNFTPDVYNYVYSAPFSDNFVQSPWPVSN
jgi:RHS repeat-associated protein